MGVRFQLFPPYVLQIRTDIIFTFGPFGYIYIPENIGSNIPIALGVRGCIWVLLLGKLIALYRRPSLAKVACFVVVVTLLLAQPLLNMMDYMVGIIGLLFILSEAPEDHRFFRVTLSFGLLASIALLTKHSTYVMLMLSLVAYFSFTYIQDQRKPSLASVLRFGCVMLMPFLAYLVYNPSLEGLRAYIVGIVDIQRGYSDAMSTLALPFREYFTISLLTILVIGSAIYGAWRRWIPLGHGVCIIAAFFVGLKHGIVRADGHIVFTYA